MNFPRLNWFAFCALLVAILLANDVSATRQLKQDPAGALAEAVPEPEPVVDVDLAANPVEELVAEQEAEFAADMKATAAMQQRELTPDGSPVEVTEASPVEEPEAPAAEDDGDFDSLEEETGEEQEGIEEDDWFWEEWDEPDKDTFFFELPTDEEEMNPGWTWDDPSDGDADLWDDEWVGERDDSFTGRVNAVSNAMQQHVTPGIAQGQAELAAGKALIRAGVGQVLGIEDHPRNNMLLDVLTFLPLVPPMLLIGFLIKAATESLTYYRLVQFACFFCASYSGLLIMAAILTGDEPLSAFQFMAGHGPYIKYQFLVATAYVLFLGLLYVNVCIERCGISAIAQQVLGTTIGLHYYMGTFHTAMVGMPPESVVGIPVGTPTYFFYTLVFLAMGAFPPREKDMTEDAEDDKLVGTGKAQD
mmetsp:Transcript_28462/g.34571  ORF Transcript_28462/g.34571 Transcript_28462/m.34571 type:complete len:418 (-) Transcript_28462:545-1798(-)|eukprot:CAMPEP_0197846686 /NCGR_PEP_ID=MMETSP1438-20131217/4006_1 /TAXON_ID=1461541 /ORGANISM="Pterosperma sp., Strain CCMP1384" /LENGTH=417 /DNA_ID=CAMNT_0043458409 /DNA_START=233 /DNA_END=1486 /DNA_ORIENTATION=+